MGPTFSRRPVFAEDRGRLTLVDFASLPFAPVRSYALSAIPDGDRRGGHGWRTQQRFLVVVSGRARATIDPLPQARVMEAGESVHIPAGHWHELEAIGDDLVVLVFADRPHEPDDAFTERG